MHRLFRRQTIWRPNPAHAKLNQSLMPCLTTCNTQLDRHLCDQAGRIWKITARSAKYLGLGTSKCTKVVLIKKYFIDLHRGHGMFGHIHVFFSKLPCDRSYWVSWVKLGCHVIQEKRAEENCTSGRFTQGSLHEDRQDQITRSLPTIGSSGGSHKDFLIFRGSLPDILCETLGHKCEPSITFPKNVLFSRVCLKNIEPPRFDGLGVHPFQNKTLYNIDSIGGFSTSCFNNTPKWPSSHRHVLMGTS